jgi:hypothetical protein
VTTEDTVTGDAGKVNRYHFDRHTPEYRERFTAITEDMHAKCPVACPSRGHKQRCVLVLGVASRP